MLFVHFALFLLLFFPLLPLRSGLCLLSLFLTETLVIRTLRCFSLQWKGDFVLRSLERIAKDKKFF